jgi:hypothetical protein
MARLSEAERVELEARRERLQLELRLIEGELRSDEALRVQAELRRPDARPRLRGVWRQWTT